LLIYRLNIKLNKIVQKEKSSNLPMVSESLMLTFNLLTGYYSRQQPSSLRFGDVIFFGGMECVEVSGCVFLNNKSTDLHEIFFRV